MHSNLDPADFGIVALHERVESWECDFNEHWNARYYARSFDEAAATLPYLPGMVRQARNTPITRLIRFHHELFVGTAVEVRSAQVADGQFAGALAHVLYGSNRMSATALDLGGVSVAGLPQVKEADIGLILPRGLWLRPMPEDWPADTRICETGPLRPTELDHEGQVSFEAIFHRVAIAAHDFANQLGLTEALVREQGISRMAVESRVTVLGSCLVGVPLRVRSHVAHVATRTYGVSHRLETHGSVPLAFVQHGILTVDLKSRKAIRLPDFLLRKLRA